MSKIQILLYSIIILHSVQTFTLFKEASQTSPKSKKNQTEIIPK